MRNQFKTQRFRIFENDNDIILSIEKDNFILDIQELLPILNSYTKQDKQSIQEYNVFITFDGCTLAGSKETPNNPLFFGELDKEGVFIESKPVYHLIGETDYDTKDSKESFTQTLQIFLNNSTLTLLNYSLLDSSLNIKLECTSSESKEILEKEQTQREQTQKESTPIDSLTSTAFLHPILEDNEIKCPHNGVVQLKSNKGKSFKSKDIPMILESDLLNSFIIGCTNNIAGVPTPCTMVATILPTARAFKKYNDDYPIMQDLVNGNVFNDKGFPITCTPKSNTFRININLENLQCGFYYFLFSYLLFFSLVFYYLVFL
ncbi:hypothetical protein [Helicobacter bilis]|uniref:hypothetical protein n=1 Tax=Helicobacter bilis TaxID=37372 RepID=UPI0026CFD90F